jgi:YVTN family beta-propeller protein
MSRHALPSDLHRHRFAVLVALVLSLVPAVSQAQNRFQRGDANADGLTNISDPVFTIGYLFLGETPPVCDDAPDSNDDGEQNITDVIYTLNFLFLGGPSPLAPYPDCGEDLTADGLGCNEFGPCGEATPVLRRPSRSSTIAITDNDRWVISANQDSGSVSVVFTPTDSLFGEIPVGREPSSVVILPDNRTAFVALRADRAVVRVSDFVTDSPTVSAPIPVGSEPSGLALSPSGRRLFVAELAEGRVSVIDTATLEVVDAIEAPRHPRSLAVTNDGDSDDDDELLIVPEFFGEAGPGAEATDTSRRGRVRVYRLSDLSPAPAIIFDPIDSGFAPSGSDGPTVPTSPNQLASVATVGGRIFVTSVSASPAPPVSFNTNVQPVVYVADLATSTPDLSAGGTTNLAVKVRDAIPVGETRHFLADLIDIAFSDAGDEGYVVSRGADALQRVVFREDGVTIGGATRAQIDLLRSGDGSLCQAPTGIALNSNATRAYVNCWVSATVRVVDLTAESLAPAIAATAGPSNDLERAVQRGKRFFFTGRARWSRESWSSCGSCHPDGLTDNITWSFPAGPRQTVSMDGTYTKGPEPVQRVLNWTAIFDELHDFERNTRGVSGGKGAVTVAGEGSDCGDVANEVQLALEGGLAKPVKEVQDETPSCTTDWDDIDEFTRTIRPPRGLVALDPLAVAAGLDLFTSTTGSGGGCVKCHGGDGWTISRLFFTPSSATNAQLIADGAIRPQPADLDNTGAAIAPPQVACVLRDVDSFGVPGDDAATDALELKDNATRAQGRGGFNVPSLFGVSLGAPYLHHGQAASLEDLFTDPLWEGHLRAGNPAFLSGPGAATERVQLLQFLLSIDAETAPLAVPEGEDICP